MKQNKIQKVGSIIFIMLLLLSGCTPGQDGTMELPSLDISIQHKVYYDTKTDEVNLETQIVISDDELQYIDGGASAITDIITSELGDGFSVFKNDEGIHVERNFETLKEFNEYMSEFTEEKALTSTRKIEGLSYQESYTSSDDIALYFTAVIESILDSDIIPYSEQLSADALTKYTTVNFFIDEEDISNFTSKKVTADLKNATFAYVVQKKKGKEAFLYGAKINLRIYMKNIKLTKEDISTLFKAKEIHANQKGKMLYVDAEFKENTAQALSEKIYTSLAFRPPFMECQYTDKGALTDKGYCIASGKKPTMILSLPVKEGRIKHYFSSEDLGIKKHDITPEEETFDFNTHPMRVVIVRTVIILGSLILIFVLWNSFKRIQEKRSKTIEIDEEYDENGNETSMSVEEATTLSLEEAESEDLPSRSK